MSAPSRDEENPRCGNQTKQSPNADAKQPPWPATKPVELMPDVRCDKNDKQTVADFRDTHAI
jgi:hypothetical protein